jgi:AcrR family transcriptional regulator
MPRTAPRKLSTADERREALVASAVAVFAEHGYHAAPTMQIAKQAGISQAYLFRLFPTKLELFLAVCEVARDRMTSTFAEAAARARATGQEPLVEMGAAYANLVETERDVLLIQLHAQVAAGREPRIREAMRNTFNRLYDLVAEESGAAPEELKTWFAHGMLINVTTAIGADQLTDRWACTLTGRAALDT